MLVQVESEPTQKLASNVNRDLALRYIPALQGKTHDAGLAGRALACQGDEGHHRSSPFTSPRSSPGLTSWGAPVESRWLECSGLALTLSQKSQQPCYGLRTGAATRRSVGKVTFRHNKTHPLCIIGFQLVASHPN